MDAIIDAMSQAIALRVTILADNVAAPPFLAEHGFSAFVEVRGADGRERAVLFDLGQGALFANAEAAGIELSRASEVVVSHGHYDHVDALPEFLARYPDARVHASDEVFREHYSLRTGTCRPIGLSVESRAALASVGRFMPVVGLSTIAGGAITLVGEIPRAHPLETPSPLLFEDAGCSVPDAVPDELFLVVDTPRGLAILTGCCHAGLINTCERARSVFPDRPIDAVIGGFHLAGVSRERMAATAAYLEGADVRLVVPCHCTGEEETLWLRDRLGQRVVPGSCGASVS